MDPWPMTEADRRALAEYLADLNDDEWDTPSLCADWTVEQVVAHVLVIPTVSKPTIFFNFLRSGFDVDRFSARMVARITGEKRRGELAAALAESAGSRSTPPGLNAPQILAEVLVHAGDVSEAVGRPLTFPTDHYVAGLEHLKDVQPALGCKERIAGLELAASDADWSHGSGPRVEGPAQYLTLAMAGRASAVDHLTGPGTDTLRDRC